MATSMEPSYEAVKTPLEHEVQTRMKETLRRDPMATLAEHFLPDNIPGNAHKQIASSLDITLEKALRVKRRLQTQHSSFHEHKSALQAQAYIHEKLFCGPNITSERLARVRIVRDGGVGMSISQALFGINFAIGRNLVPILDQQELLWFSNAGMGIHDLFHLPCRPPAHILAQAESIDAASCDDVSCDRKKARNAVRIPPPFAHLPLMWWWRQLARSVVQPSPRVLAGMHSILRTAGFPFANPVKDPINFAPTLEDSPFGTLFDFKDAPRPLIAVHMRRGDSCTGGRPVCLSDAQSVHDLLVEKGLSNGTLLVASDSSALLDELDDLVESNSYDSTGTRFQGQIASIHLNRTFYESFATKSSLRAKAYEDNKETKALVRSSGLALEALLDLALLAEGEIHVGSFFSNFIRGAMNLSGRNARSRYVSFDAQWCPFDICSLGCETHQVWLRKLARLHSPESTWPNYDRTQGLTEELLRLPREDYYDVLSDFQADAAKIVVTTLRMHSGQ
ncbi:Hypothetical Protein FCC1311_001162 [Hondaea fermentalgiana]|uniref:Alpha-(1,6)-fucosyltransferase n=1 Tax=Hondaea fermentalgiana TaxID=2315210 RepID=A0A2R5FYR9_9STRA|nr:Hypothetical Protein FCC1311_001162 [Hondaea fermentalgiana]|eukprot:GBG23897.1 Hypothetical Protein FCC1311_001162 [Hondaea fermentalgiana]